MAFYDETITEELIIHDTPSLTDLATFAKLLFDQTCKAVRAMTLPEEQQRVFECHANKLGRSLEVILCIEDKQCQRAALDAAISALSIGDYHPGNSEVVQVLKTNFRKEQTAPANAGRKGKIGIIIACHINKIISDRERSHGKGKHGYTKKTIISLILPGVIQEVSKLDPVPEKWKVENPEKLTKAERTQVRENIRVHVRRSKVFG